jgi:hypothetical protein
MSSHTPFTRADLEAAVINEIDGMADVTDEHLRWIVEATVFQLARAIERRDHVDMDYIGEFRRVQLPDGPVYYRFHPRLAGMSQEVA